LERLYKIYCIAMLAPHVVLLLVIVGFVSAQYYYYPCRGIGDKTAVHCNRRRTACPGTALCDTKFGVCCCGSTKLNCFVEPCRFAKCPNFPTAKCLNEFCRGCCCEARFFLKSKEITKFCWRNTIFVQYEFSVRDPLFYHNLYAYKTSIFVILCCVYYSMTLTLHMHV